MENSRIGPFQVLQRLGNSNRQKVFRAVQIEQNREVALKFIKLPPTIEKAKALSRIQRETKILKRMVHPNLVRVYGAGVERDNIFFAMELVEGETLSQILTRRGKLAWDLAVEYARQIAIVLEYIHSEEVIHLKLNPEKILIQDDDGAIKVTDLRLNRSRKRRWDHHNQKSLEVAAYLSPEQLSGEAGTGKSDFYSLGVMLFEMLTGRLPFAPETMSQLIKQKQTQSPPPVSDFNLDCPVWLEKIVAHLLHVDPARRPHSARAIVLALQEVQEIDSSGTGVAEKLTGSFNPLTAGLDKTEARKVLGFEPDKEPTVSIFQRRWFQISALVIPLILIAGIIGFILRPATDQQLYERATALVASERSSDWLKARADYLEPLMERGEDRPYFEKAKELEKTIKMQRMQLRIENHQWSRRNDSQAQKRFFRGLEYEEELNYRRAATTMERLIRDIDPQGDEAYLLEIVKEKEVQLLAAIEAENEQETNGSESTLVGADPGSHTVE